MHWEDAEHLLFPCDTLTDREVSKTAGRQELVLSSTDNSSNRGGLVGGGDICCLTLEHNCTVHRNQTHNGSTTGGKAAPLGMVVPEVAGTGENGPGRDVGGIKGGG